MEHQFKDFDVQVKEAGEDTPRIVAYASTFDREPDSYGDVVAKGAFADTLKKWAESGNTIPLLFGHRMDDPEYNIGSVVRAEEDDRGLLIEAEFDMTNPKAAYTHKLVMEKRLCKLSFAFDVLDRATVTLADGTKANELRKLDIFEVSLVPVPANQHAEVIEAKDGECEVKQGRVISAKNESELNAAVEHLEAAKSVIRELLNQLADDSNNDEVKSEEPTEVKADAEEPTDVQALQKSALLEYIDKL